jgi:hypothetical protein
LEQHWASLEQGFPFALHIEVAVCEPTGAVGAAVDDAEAVSEGTGEAETDAVGSA